MPIEKAPTLNAFVTQIDTLTSALKPVHRDSLVTQDLKLIRIRSVSMLVIEILHWIGSWLGIDYKANLRSRSVLSSLKSYCDANREYLQKQPRLIYKVSALFSQFFDVTRKKHRKSISQYQEKLTELLQPHKVEVFEPREVRETVSNSMQLNSKQKKELKALISALKDLFKKASSYFYVFYKRTQSALSKNNGQLTLGTDPVLYSTKSKPTTLRISFPVDLLHKEEGPITDIIALFPQIIAAGAERDIHPCYSLRESISLIRAQVQSTTERTILGYYKENPQPGLPCIWGWRGKNEFYQNLHLGDLLGWISIEDQKPTQNAFGILTDTLKGLTTFHLSKVVEPSHHSDVTPENMLIKDNFSAIIDDFGFAGTLDDLPLKPGYMPPEIARQYREIIERVEGWEGKVRSLNENHGQAKDMWCMGLVFLVVLTGVQEVDNHHFTDITSPPTILSYPDLPRLAFIHRAISEFSMPDRVEKIHQQDCDKMISGPLEMHFASVVKELSQEDVDKDIDELKSIFQQRYPNYKNTERLWALIKGMLNVNPDERITSEQALTELLEILPPQYT